MVQHLKSIGKMAINKVDLKVTQLVNDLNEGMTWFKKDDLGYGSIENKYGANAPQIMAIRKHPALKDAETSLTIFNIIDDTKKESHSDQVIDVMNKTKQVETIETVSEAADIFANL